MTLLTRTGLSGIDLRRMGLIAEVLGAPELMERLRMTSIKIQRKVVRASVNAGLTELTSEMRRQIDASPMSPALKRAMKATVGKRIKNKQNEMFGILEAKAGLGVGKRTKARRELRRVARSVRAKAGKGGKKGVGVDAWNVHWFGIGTRPRRTKRGKFLGRLTAQQVVWAAYQAAGSRAISAIARRASELIDRELNL